LPLFGNSEILKPQLNKAERKRMSEVKVAIEWDSNSKGLHDEPMKVHIAGEADPNEIIGAIAKAMGMAGKPSQDSEFIHLMPTGNGNVMVCLTDGQTELFPSYRQALEFIEAYSAHETYRRTK
jgi:hypothetical protein